MSKERLKQVIESRVIDDRIVETGVQGVQLFRVTHPMRCAPAVYEPTVVAIVSGSKEAILNAQRYVYDGRCIH